MDILGKAAGRVGKALGQAAATAADWYRLESEQCRLVDDLRAQFEGSGSALPATPLTILEGDHFEVVDRALPPPPAPAAPTRILPGTRQVFAATTVDDRDGFCPACGRPHPGNKPFCGYCGARLA